jgi:hypothetical protein
MLERMCWNGYPEDTPTSGIPRQKFWRKENFQARKIIKQKLWKQTINNQSLKSNTMKQTKQERNMIFYGIIMLMLATTILVCTIILWYKADKTGRYLPVILIILGYWAAIEAFRNRKPIR